MRAPVDRWDLCAAAGSACLALGGWMIYRPAGVIVGGVVLLVVAFTGARGAKGGVG